MKRRRFSIRWLLLGVAGASLFVHALAIFSLRSFDALLVRQTERELNAQAALVAAIVQHSWTEARGHVPGNPRDKWHLQDTYTPLSSTIVDLDHVAPPLPDPLPSSEQQRTPQEQEIADRISAILRNAQVFNLSGVRVLDSRGCVLASSRAQFERCFSGVPEVERALSGRSSAVLRQRVSDEPPPPLHSFGRRGELRVFVAQPVWNDGQVLGVVLLSRTAESAVEWLFKRRRDAFYGILLLFSLAVSVSLGFSLLITRPLSKMRRRLQDASTGGELLALSEISAPAEIHLLGVALDQRAKMLDEKTRYVAEFAANVSHELKTPLTSIRGAVELLTEQGESMSAEQRAKFLTNIDDAALRTSRLVTRLLKLARLEARQEYIDDEVELLTWLEGLRESYGDSIAVEMNAPESTVISASALESIVTNLIDNARRYARNLPVRVMFELGQEDRSGLIHLVVSDDGPGIRPEDQSRLFERFFTTERDRGGTGLGLSIVQATAQNRGGRVSIRSGAQGTVVEVWF